MAVSLLVLGAVALVFAVFVQTRASDTAERAVPIDPNNAVPATVLAEAARVSVSTPIRPANLTGLGYHPEGESLAAMQPRGKNLSANVFLGLLSKGETPERIHYYVMDAAGRDGPQTGAIDVGATTGTTVYAPVTGTVTAIRPDPMVQNANIIEIKPDANPDVRLSVALVRSDGEAGVNDYVTAGKTELGTVADSAEVLDPQLSSYTTDAGNHVTVSVSKTGFSRSWSHQLVSTLKPSAFACQHVSFLFLLKC
ncbi:hypothetical protein BH20ACT12_BH20ACT12_08710 [soil metagenome]